MQKKNIKEIERALKVLQKQAEDAREKGVKSENKTTMDFMGGYRDGVHAAIELIHQAEDAESTRKTFTPEISGVKL